MALLIKYSNNEPNETKDKTLTARIKPSLYNDFKVHCDELGINISRAIELLIENELNDTAAETEKETNTNAIKKADNEKPSYNSNRFTTTQYEKNNKLPCPICKKWYSKANFSRHTKKEHKQTTQQLFEGNLDKLMEMITT